MSTKHRAKLEEVEEELIRTKQWIERENKAWQLIKKDLFKEQNYERKESHENLQRFTKGLEHDTRNGNTN